MTRNNYTLRPLKPEDAPRMVEMMRDAQTTQYLQIGGPGYTLETALGFICGTADERVNLHRAVVDEQDVYQGSVSLKHIDHEKQEIRIEQALVRGEDGSVLKAPKSYAGYRTLPCSRFILNRIGEGQNAESFVVNASGIKISNRWQAAMKKQEMPQKAVWIKSYINCLPLV